MELPGVCLSAWEQGAGGAGLTDTVHLPSLADLSPSQGSPSTRSWRDGIPPPRSDRITQAPCVILVPSNCFLVTFYC